MNSRHMIAEKGSGLHYRTALWAAEPAVGLPHVQGKRHAAPEELRTLVTVELDPAVHKVDVLVEV